MRKVNVGLGLLSLLSLLFVGLRAVYAQQKEEKKEVVKEERRIEIIDGQVKVFINGREVPLSEAFAQGGPFGQREMKIIVDGKEMNFPFFVFGGADGQFQPFMRRFALGGRLPNKRVDLNANDVALSEALERLFKEEGYAVKFEDGVNKEAKVTAVLKNVPFDLALRAIIEQANVGFRLEGEKTVLITKDRVPPFGAFANVPRVVDFGNFPNAARFQQNFPYVQSPFIARGGGRSGGVVTVNGKTIRSGVENEEFFIELEGSAKATIRTLDKDGKTIKTNTLDVKDGKQKVSLKLSDVPSDGSGVISLEMDKSNVEIIVKDGGKSIVVKAQSTRG
jgi:hypothetical protein